MDKKVISYLLKAVALLLFAVVVFTGAYLVPSYLRFWQRYLPHIAPLFTGALVYINLSFVPMYLCLFMAWRVFSTVGQDNAFCPQNARRLRTASWLALVDVGMVAAFYLFLRIRYSYMISPFFLFSSVGLILIGLSASIVCFALAKLVAQAAALKQEVDLTV